MTVLFGSRSVPKKKGAAEAAPEGYPVTGKDQNFLVRLTFQVRPRPLAVNGS